MGVTAFSLYAAFYPALRSMKLSPPSRSSIGPEGTKHSCMARFKLRRCGGSPLHHVCTALLPAHSGLSEANSTFCNPDYGGCGTHLQLIDEDRHHHVPIPTPFPLKKPLGEIRIPQRMVFLTGNAANLAPNEDWGAPRVSSCTLLAKNLRYASVHSRRRKKTRLISLLLRFYDIKRCQILLDGGVDISRIQIFKIAASVWHSCSRTLPLCTGNHRH